MGVMTVPDSPLTVASSTRWTCMASRVGIAGVLAATTATASLVVSVRIDEAAETIATLGLAALGFALVLALTSAIATVVALTRREGRIALSPLVFVALALVIAYLAPAIGLWAAGP